MYRIAQWVVRHKVLVVGVGCAAFIFMGKDPEPVKPANPWSAQADASVAVAETKKDSLATKAYGAVAGAAKEYAGVDIKAASFGKAQETSKENFDNTSAALGKVNGN